MSMNIVSPFQMRVRGDSLRELFRPLELLNIAKLYEHYAAFIDFAIYLLIFVGLAQITLGEHFQGRGGKAVIIGVGISLAVSLAIAGQYIGFSIRSFGPIAAGIFLALLGLMIYRLIKHLGAGIAASGSVAYVIVLLSIVAVVPGFFSWINQAMPLLNLILIVGLFIAIYNVISHLFRKYGVSDKLKEQLGQVNEKYDNETGSLKESERQEHQIQKITRKAFKNSNQILDDLLEVLKLIKQHGQVPSARKIIRDQIEKILPEQNELMRIIQKLQELNKRVLAFDLSLYSKETQRRYQQLSGEEKKLLKKKLHDEYVKIGIERRLPELEKRIQEYEQGIRIYLKRAANSLFNGNVPEAKNIIMRAINIEKETTMILCELRVLEQHMLKHTKRELAIERQTEIFLGQ